jgi:hypothetical protein
MKSRRGRGEVSIKEEERQAVGNRISHEDEEQENGKKAGKGV